MVGECWAKSDLDGFRNIFSVAKYVYTIYALLVVLLVIPIYLFFSDIKYQDEGYFFYSVILAGVYLVLNYESLPEQQSFTGVNRQTVGNKIQLIRILLFAALVFFLLPQFKSLSAVWIGLISGVLLQRFIAARYWNLHIGNIGWKRVSKDMKPIFQRLTGRQGAGYISYGALLLLLQADTMIIGMIGGAQAAGQFVLLWKIPEAIGLLLCKIPATIEPKVIQYDTSGNKKALKSLFVQGRRWFILLVFLVSCIYILAGQWLAQLWVGEHAPQEHWMYIIAGVALFLNTISRWPVSFAYSLVKLRPLVKISFIEAFLKIFIIIVLYDNFGIASPLVAIVVIHSLYATMAYQKIILE